MAEVTLKIRTREYEDLALVPRVGVAVTPSAGLRFFSDAVAVPLPITGETDDQGTVSLELPESTDTTPSYLADITLTPPNGTQIRIRGVTLTAGEHWLHDIHTLPPPDDRNLLIQEVTAEEIAAGTSTKLYLWSVADVVTAINDHGRGGPAGGGVDQTARDAAQAAQAAADAAKAEIDAHLASSSSHDLADGEVTTDKIADGAVTAAKLATDAVTQEKVADDAIGGRELAGDSVASGHLKNASVTTDKIENNAVTGRKIAADSIERGHLGDNVVGTAELVDGEVTEDKLTTAVRTKLNDRGTGTEGTDQTARDAAAAAAQAAAGAQTTAEAAGRAAMTADNKAEAAQLDADTVIEIGPPITHEADGPINLSVSIRHPLNAYQTANTVSVNVGGQTPVLVTYDNTTFQQDTLVEVSANALNNIWALRDTIPDGQGGTTRVQRYHIGSYIPVDVRLQIGRDGTVVFDRILDVLVVEAPSEDVDQVARDAAAAAQSTATTAANAAAQEAQDRANADTALGNRITNLIPNQVDNARITGTQGLSIWAGTRAQYNAITTKDANTLYFVDEP